MKTEIADKEPQERNSWKRSSGQKQLTKDSRQKKLIKDLGTEISDKGLRTKTADKEPQDRNS
jgi:hypothetical protein